MAKGKVDAFGGQNEVTLLSNEESPSRLRGQLGRPWSAPRSQEDCTPKGRQPSCGPRQELDDNSLRRLVRSACSELGKKDEADHWVDVLQAEWMDVARLRSLSADDWSRLGLPMGFQTELRKRLGAAQRSTPARPSSRKPPRPVHGGRRADSVSSASGDHPPATRVGGEGPRRLGKGLCEIRDDLCQRYSNRWSVALMQSLEAQGTSAFDVDSLDRALRAVGVTVAPAQLRSLLRAAMPEGGLPGAQDIVNELYGPLPQERLDALRAVFGSLDVKGKGSLGAGYLRRRCAPLQHPSVKLGRMSAEDALRSLTKAWSGVDRVDFPAFVVAHYHLSSRCFDDREFANFACRLWRVPLDRVPGSTIRPRPPVGAVLTPQEVACARRCSEPSPAHSGSAWRPASAPPARQNGRTGPRGRTDSVGGIIREALVVSGGSPSGLQERRQHYQLAARRAHRGGQVLARLRAALLGRGCDVLADLAVGLRTLSEMSDGRMDAEILLTGLQGVGIGASLSDAAQLLSVVDLDDAGTVDVEEWLRDIRGSLPPKRCALVRAVFQTLDVDGNGAVDFEELQRRFVPSGHPDVVAGRKSSGEVMSEFLSRVGDADGDGRITAQEFERYYENVSVGVRSDQHFADVVRSAWGIDSTASLMCARNRHADRAGHIHNTAMGISS